MKQFNFLNNEKFDDLLRQRPMIPPSQHLTARIVAAAIRAPEIIANFSFSLWLQELFADFMLPKPAYALSGMLVVGILSGFLLAPVILAENTSLLSHNMILADEGDLP